MFYKIILVLILVIKESESKIKYITILESYILCIVIQPI